MRIDFYGDLTCPWCHLGWRRLHTALQLRPNLSPVLRWRPYQLNPDVPTTGLDRSEYLLRKFGNAERVREVLQTVEAAMRLEGLHVNLQRIRVMPSTYLAHRLMLVAESIGRADAFLQEIFISYFVQGKHVGDPAILREVAQLARLPHTDIDKELDNHAPHPEIAQSEQEARQIGIRAVPFVLFDGKFSIAGAHDAVAFLPLIDLCALQDTSP